MKEQLLYFVWEFQRFSKIDLCTIDGKTLQIISPGFLNKFSGPDFEEASIIIDEIAWHGKVEIHLKASDWRRHQHHEDESYNQVVLHVVWECDCQIYRPDNTLIPVLEIKKRVSQNILSQATLFQMKEKPACRLFLKDMDRIHMIDMYEKVLAERLERKVQDIQNLYDQGICGEEVLHKLLIRNFGFNHNKIGFSLLGEVLPYMLLRKHLDQPFQVFDFVLGQAGFLENYDNDFENELHNEYVYLAHKYDLLPMKIKPGVFKTGGLRPPNHPKKRLIQYCYVLMKQMSLYETFSTSFTIKEYYNIFLFKKMQQGVFPKLFNQTKLPQSTVDNILINTVVPFRCYIDMKHDKMAIDTIISLLLDIKKEINYKTSKMEKCGFLHKSALDSQSLLELWDHYCQKNRCLECKIGIKIMNK